MEPTKSVHDVISAALDDAIAHHSYKLTLTDAGRRKIEVDFIMERLAANQLAVVPREPTMAMRRAADERRGTGHPHVDIWRAMFDAISPSPLPTGE